MLHLVQDGADISLDRQWLPTQVPCSPSSPVVVSKRLLQSGIFRRFRGNPALYQSRSMLTHKTWPCSPSSPVLFQKQSCLPHSSAFRRSGANQALYQSRSMSTRVNGPCSFLNLADRQLQAGSF